jgi:hypothetical protein
MFSPMVLGGDDEMAATKIKKQKRKYTTRPLTPQRPDAIAFTLRGFQALGGPGRTKIYELAKTGVLEVFKDAAGRTMVTGKSARALLGIKDEEHAK